MKNKRRRFWALLLILSVVSFAGADFAPAAYACDNDFTMNLAASDGMPLAGINVDLREYTSIFMAVDGVVLRRYYYTWTSSNEDVAWVCPYGRIFPKSVGKTRITVTDGTYTGSISIYVTNQFEEVTDVSLNKTSLQLLPSQGYYLNYSVMPYNATNRGRATWSSSDPSVATVSSSGYVMAKGPGTATIKAEIYELSGNGYNRQRDTCQVTVFDTANSTTKTLAVEAGKEYTVGFSVKNRSNTGSHIYAVRYDASKLAVQDLKAHTYGTENSSSTFTDGNVEIVSVESGLILFRVTNQASLGASFSGILNTIKFKGLSNGTANVEMQSAF